MSRVIQQILRNLLTGWLAIAIRLAIALALVPFLLSHLGQEGYGLVGLLGVIVSMAGVADLGLRAALSRELCEQVARKDQQAFNELASTALLLYFLISVFLAAIGFILAPWLVTVFNVTAVLQGDAVRLIRIYGTCAVIFSFITPVFSAALASHHRYDLVNSANMIGGITSSLLLFVVVSIIANPIYGWAGVMFVFQAVLLAVNVLFFRRFCHGARLGIKFLNPARLRPLFHLGGYMYMFQLSHAIAEHSDPLVVSYFFGPAGVALYQPGGRFSSMVRPLVMMFSDQMLPLATKSHVENDQRNQKRILYDGTRFMLLMGTLFSVGIAVFAMPFCRLWLEGSLGKDYRTVALIMISWAIVDFTTFVQGTSWSTMLGMGVKFLRPGAIIRVVASVFNIAISIWLVGYTRMGVPGVLVATIITGLVLRPIFITLVARFCKLSILDYLRNAHLRGLIVAGVLAPLAFAVKKWCDINNYFDLALAAALTGIFWGLLVWLIGLKKQERLLIFYAIKNRIFRL